MDPLAYRLFYKLNKNTRIKVRTGCGDSEYEEVGDILGQGSGGAAKVSALNLSRKLDRVFEDDKDIVGYGSVIQKPYSFQDDIMIPVDSLENVRTVNVKVDLVMKMMQTKLNEDKSGYILMGPEEQVKEARERASINPIMCGQFKMKELQKEKWLGDQFTGSLKQSVMATIKDREGKVRRASYEIVNIQGGFF